MTIVYCDNENCAFQKKGNCVKSFISLRDHAFLPPTAFLRACTAYEKDAKEPTAAAPDSKDHGSMSDDDIKATQECKGTSTFF